MEKKTVAMAPADYDQYFHYEGGLGCRYTEQKTSFRVWAPSAEAVMLVIYGSHQDSAGTEYDMSRSEKGTWTAVLDGDHDGLVYTYKVKHGGNWRETADPYARAVTVNGDRSAVVNLEDTNPPGWPARKPDLKSKADTVIYELHVRDATIDPSGGFQHRGKFLGLTERGTVSRSGQKTGLDHIIDLGVTHVQLLPIFDYATVDESKQNPADYNWGYDPKNYNAPEGSYSLDPYDPKARIRECKQMIQAFHEAGIRVIMDVVFNHVYSVEDSAFEKLVPGYYFRRDASGNLSNGTGVGNDTASERKMMRKFIIDSLVYWAEEYQLDGFRFDLMGIHDTETMNGARSALDKVDPDIIMLGEGWILDTPLSEDQKANQQNALDMPGIAHFNDYIRDALKGSALEEKEKGFVNGGDGLEDAVKKGIAAGLASGGPASFPAPQHSVVYAEAHDNHTLWDKLKITNPDAGEEELRRRHMLASAIVLTSQGIPFLHAGQEFMRTKGGIHDSYNQPDEINKLDWERSGIFQKEIEYLKGLILLRKTFSSFRLESYEEIEKRLQFLDSPKETVAFLLHDEEGTIAVIHNAGTKEASVTLPDSGSWEVLAEAGESGAVPLRTIAGPHVHIAGLSSVILKKLQG